MTSRLLLAISAPPRLRPFALFLLLLGASNGSVARAQSAADIVNTRHNLSSSGPGTIRALTETRICVFCHTPHSAAPRSPLWNKEIEPQVYVVYASPTLKSGPLPQPSGSTKLCLSCHDGTIAMGAVLNPAGGISMAGSDTLAPGSLAHFGLDLSGHHPVSFSYRDALPNAELASSPPADLVYGGADEVHCITCHDPHNDENGKFLVEDNRFSALCVRCHQINGWTSSAHATSTVSVAGILPRPPKTWPTYTQLGEWGCEACHTPHFAPTAEQLLNFTAAPPDPFSCTSTGCHGSAPGAPHARASAGAAFPQTADIARQIRKISGHHEPPGVTPMTLRQQGIGSRSGLRSVACADCHNPHLATDAPAKAPLVSGMLRGVSGVDRNGAGVRSAAYEYEICFKCHSDNTPDVDYVPRVVSVTNTRRAFDPSNPSFHPVIAIGNNLDVPSIPSRFEPSMTASDLIYCTSCHGDDEDGSRGAHGSSFVPLLRERYETTDNTPETYESYALCYRCHERSIVALSDALSFPKRTAGTRSGGGHSGHLADGAPCSACHDPHGVNDPSRAPATGPGSTGSHTHLINFDTRIVCATRETCNVPGPPYPRFIDNGLRSGSCNLFCHNVLHADSCAPNDPRCVVASYP